MMRYFHVGVFAILLFLVGCGGGKIDTNMNESFKEPDFEFTTEANEKMTLEELKGKYWVADMIFTNCTSVCLPMTYHMTLLQKMIDEEGLDVELVSFSVDPDFDTPEVLTQYAADHGADLKNWTFLTGYDFQTMKEISVKTFKSLLVEPPKGDDQVTHGTKFYLVDPDGKVIKYYNGMDPEEMKVIMKDLKKLH